MGESAIHWTDYTWNPTTGCDRVSPGCDHCYAMTLAARLQRMGNPRYANDGSPRTSGPGFGLTLHHDKVDEPLGWRKPRRVFVNSMSDLFHSKVPYDFLVEVFAVMGLAHRHRFQVLTKRPRRMQSVLGREQFKWDVTAAAAAIAAERNDPQLAGVVFDWPLPNVWLGTSVEDQERAELRIPHVLRTPAAVRFLSCEPLLGPLDLRGWLMPHLVFTNGRLYAVPAHRIETIGRPGQPKVSALVQLDWLIVGGESGPGHRPMDLRWARSLRGQCAAANVAFFYKQGSGPRPGMHRELDGRLYEAMPA